MEMLGKGADKGDLDELRGLDGDADDGDGEPALVGGLHTRAGVTRHQGQTQESHREDQHEHPEPIHNEVVIQIGDDEGEDHPQHRHGELHLQLAHAEVVHRAVDRHQTDDRQHRSAEQKHPIHAADGFGEEYFDLFAHGGAPFRKMNNE